MLRRSSLNLELLEGREVPAFLSGLQKFWQNAPVPEAAIVLPPPPAEETPQPPPPGTGVVVIIPTPTPTPTPHPIPGTNGNLPIG